MKKSFTRVIAAVLTVVVLIAGTSLMSFAATPGENIESAFSDLINAITTYSWDDFFGFVSAILGVFGFQGDFEGAHSIPELVNEWFEMLGPIGDFYENFINNVNTADLLAFLLGFVSAA